jgi:phosphoribosylanthranilate isomerase
VQGIVQIAGVADRAEAMMLVEAGVHQIGFPLGLPVHREDISAGEAAKIIRLLEPPASAVLITYLNRAEEILEISKKIGVRKVQLHGRISLAEIVRLKSIAPDLTVIKSLIVGSDNLAELEASVAGFSFHCDAFIIDTYDPATGACGATGKVHDWDISRRLRDISPKPVMLAGGLNPDNVCKAIAHVRPAGVDAHTGVEGSDGRKDAVLVRTFVREALAAFQKLSL